MSKCEEEALWNQQQQPPATKTSRHLSWLLLGLCIGTLLVAALAAVEVAALRAEQSRLRADLDDLARRLHDDPQLEQDIRRFHQESLDSDQELKFSSSSSTTTKSPIDQYDSDYSEYSNDDDDNEDNYDDDDVDEDDKDDYSKDEIGDELNDQAKGKAREKRDVELAPPVRVHGAAVLGRTSDGVPVVSHSYQQVKQLNRSGVHLRLYDNLAAAAPLPVTEDPIRPYHRVSPLWTPPKKHSIENKKSSHSNRKSASSSSAGGATPGPMMERRSRVMQTPEEGDSVSLGPSSAAVPPGTVLRVLQEQPPQAHQLPPPTYVQRPRAAGGLVRSLDPAAAPQEGRKMRRKYRNGAPHREDGAANGNHHPFRVAAHFTANSSMYTLAHPNYKGNGRLRHAGVFTDWSASSFMDELALNRYFTLKDGTLTVKLGGLYYFYSQIYYIEEHDNNGYNVYVNNVVKLQCVTTTHSNSNIVKVNTCFTGGVLFLQPGDTIFLRDIAGLRYSLFEAEKSFFGLFRFANAQARSPFN